MNFFSKNIIAKCGHKTKIKGKVSAFGESGVVTIPKNEDGTIDFCLKCIEEMTIRCAWCGKPIFVGQPVTLYSPISPEECNGEKEFKMPDYAVIYQKKPLQLVGCLRWECAQSGGDRAGFWIPPGKVHRVLSPVEQCLKNIIDEDGDGVVAVGNLHDPKEAMPIKG